MKFPVRQTKQILTVACLLLWVAGITGFLIPAQAVSDNSVADEIISLNVTDRPLGEVLENLSIAANCQFSIDERWEGHPITASFDNEPLYSGLKLILRDINNAVIYGADRTVKIIVFDDGTNAGKSAGQSLANKMPQDFIQEPLISGDATAPQPEVEISESSNDTEGGVHQSGEAAESGAETNEVDADSNESREGEPIDESSEGKTAAIETEGKESGAEEENDPTEETDSTSGDSADSESIETNEEPKE